MNSLDAAAQAFLDEAKELLDELEETLLELESDPHNPNLVARAFRAMHTLKGSGAMFGFDEIARFTHDIENIYDHVREGLLVVDHDLLTLTLAAKDHIGTLLCLHPGGDSETISISNGILERFQDLLPEDASKSAVKSIWDSDIEAREGQETAAPTSTYWIRIMLHEDVFLSGTNPYALLEEIDSMGTARMLFHSANVPYLEEYIPEKCYGFWDVMLTTDQGENALRDVFIFQDSEEYHLAMVCLKAIRTTDLEELTEMLRCEGEADLFTVQQRIEEDIQRRLTPREPPDTDSVKEVAPAILKTAEKSSSIRVDSERLDALVDMVGEMVIIQSRLAQAVQGHIVPAVFNSISEDLERLTDEMRENALGLRMLPIGTAYNALRRLVRDLADSLGKEVEFVTEGAETELDKTVIDQLKDPLVHILRNSMDHGIEPVVVRRNAGKKEKGLVSLSARHSSANVVISIEDDGKGLDPDKIRDKAISRGIITQDTELSLKETLELIFEPGFSMAEQVTDVSGRGVGMDVVKRSIEGLRGTIDIASTPSEGTVFTIRLPLTLAIIDGFNVKIENESYIVPLTTLRGFQERLVEGNVRTLETMKHMEHMIPCVSLRNLLDVPGKQPEYERVVITEVDGKVVGLSVDQVVGRQQAVIKSLGDTTNQVQWISGTTVNGDGSISVILDIPQLVRFASGQSYM